MHVVVVVTYFSLESQFDLLSKSQLEKCFPKEKLEKVKKFAEFIQEAGSRLDM